MKEIVKCESSAAQDDALTLRHYFAAATLSGLMAGGQTAGWKPERIASYAFKVADAMVANQKQEIQNGPGSTS